MDPETESYVVNLVGSIFEEYNSLLFAYSLISDITLLTIIEHLKEDCPGNEINFFCWCIEFAEEAKQKKPEFFDKAIEKVSNNNFLKDSLKEKILSLLNLVRIVVEDESS